MNLRTQLVCAWLGPIGTVILFLAMFFLMHILPPLSVALRRQPKPQPQPGSRLFEIDPEVFGESSDAVADGVAVYV